MSPQPTGTDGVGPSLPVNRARPHRARSLCAGLVVLGAAACSATSVASSTVTTGPTTVTTAPATTATTAAPATTAPVTTPASDEDQVRAVVDRYWEVWLAVGDPPDPSSPALSEVMTGEALAREVENLEKKIALGDSRRQPANSRFDHLTLTVVVRGDAATVTECVVDDMVVLDTDDGTIRNSAVATFVLEKSVLRSEGIWKIERSSILQQDDGVRPCGG